MVARFTTTAVTWAMRGIFGAAVGACALGLTTGMGFDIRRKMEDVGNRIVGRPTFDEQTAASDKCFVDARAAIETTRGRYRKAKEDLADCLYREKRTNEHMPNPEAMCAPEVKTEAKTKARYEAAKAVECPLPPQRG